MNNKARSALVLVAMLSFTGEAQAEKIRGFGGSDCGAWISQPNKAAQQSWLLGYLSGQNWAWTYADMVPGNPLEMLLSADQAFVWMDNYCRKNPLERLATGADELFLELVKKMRQSQ